MCHAFDQRPQITNGKYSHGVTNKFNAKRENLFSRCGVYNDQKLSKEIHTHILNHRWDYFPHLIFCLSFSTRTITQSSCECAPSQMSFLSLISYTRFIFTIFPPSPHFDFFLLIIFGVHSFSIFLQFCIIKLLSMNRIRIIQLSNKCRLIQTIFRFWYQRNRWNECGVVLTETTIYKYQSAWPKSNSQRASFRLKFSISLSFTLIL